MNQFTVHILARSGTKQLLFIADTNSICVYDEHSGSTLMRQVACCIDSLKLAMDLLNG